MTKPRIEELVKSTEKKINDRIYMDNGGIHSIKQMKDIEREEWTKALTQAHQAGIYEAVEKLKKNYIQPIPEANGNDIDDYMRGYNQALDDTIKALQDNK